MNYENFAHEIYFYAYSILVTLFHVEWCNKSTKWIKVDQAHGCMQLTRRRPCGAFIEDT